MAAIMTEAFIKLIFEASLTAGIAAAAVMLIRIPLKKAPKRWSYLLWAVVFFRCLCPFSVESTFSLFNAVPEKSVISESDTDIDEAPRTEQQADIPAEARYTENTPAPLPSMGTFYNPYGGYDEPRYADYSGYANFAENDNTESVSEADDTETTVKAVNTDEAGKTEKAVNVHTILLIVWLAGVAAMAVYGVLSYARLMRKIRTAVKTEDGVYETDLIPTAFSAGFFPAKVYIPCGLSDTEHRLIVTHERVHIRRCDHITKLLAFAALAVHWFNPLIWAAFTLMTKDMELSCDEAVLKICGAEEKKDYSRALLRVSMKRSGLAVIPIAFGETGIKGRVKNVLGYKKPRAVATLLAGALVISACAVLGTNAVKSDEAAAAEDERVLLEKGTTEFIDVNGEKIFFAHGDRDDAFKVSGTSTDSVLRYRNASGDIRSVWFSDVVDIGDLVGMSMNEEYVGSTSGGIDIDCDISEITINDIYVKRGEYLYYVAVSLDVLADDTFPEKFRCETWAPESVNIEINGGDGKYTVNAEIAARFIENEEADYYGLALLGFDDTLVYAAKNLNIVGHLDSNDAQNESRVLLEKGTTEFEDGNGESVYFAYGDNVVYTNYHGDDVENVTTPILKYEDESGNIHDLQIHNYLKGFLGVTFSADENGKNIGSAGGVDMDCNVSEITINDIYVKFNDGFYYVSLSMYVLADDTLPEKTGCYTWQQSSAEIDVKGGNGRYIVNADIKTQWAGGGNADWVGSTRHENFGVALIGFDDIPVYASKDLKIVGHMGGEDVKNEQPQNSGQAEQATNNQQSRSVSLEKGKTEFMGSGGDRIFLSYKEENPMAYYPPEAPEAYEKNYADIVYVGFPGHIGTGSGFTQSDVPALTAEVYSQNNSGNRTSVSNSLRGGIHDILIDSDVSQITVNDLDIKHDNDKILLCLDLDVWADKWTSDLVKFSEVIDPNAPETSSVLTAVPSVEDGRICNIKAEIEMPSGNVGYGLVLSGFEDIPIIAADKAAEKFVNTLTNEEVKQAYLEKMKELQEEAKPSPALPLSMTDIGTYGANNKNILFSVPKGTEVLASLDGTVKSAEKGFNHGYGFSIEISHADGMSTFYAHLDDFAVEVGDEVKKGDVIGYSGSSGDTLGDALLFEIRKDGVAEDPRNYYFFGADDYQRTLDEIGKDHVDDGVGIAGIYSEDGRLISGTDSETIEIEGVTYYIISTEEQLRAIAAGEYGMDKNFLQNGNIYLSSDEWIPIGTKDDPFTGTYAGNGFEIIGLTMKDPDATRIGMFGYAENAEIYNITLRDYDIFSAGRNAKTISVAPILPVVTGGTRCYDNYAYPNEEAEWNYLF